MSKVDHVILKSTAYMSTIGLFVDLAILNYLNIQKNAIIHNLETDILIDKWWEVCTSLRIVFIPLAVISILCLVLIYRRKKQPVAHYDSVKESVADLVPTIRRTSQGHREQQKIVISDSFKELFMPDFCKKSEIGIIPFEIMKEELEKGTWTVTDIGRIARMCFEAKVQQPKFKHFNHWMKAFCENIGRTDCPEKPDKKSYKVAKESDLLSTYSCIVRIGETRFSDYKNRISQ